MNHLSYAKAYVQLGWYVFPIAERGKRPITENGFKDASIDENVIAAWWHRHPNANIGIDCGRSNIAVIDIDGVEALERWNKVAEKIQQRRVLISDTGSGTGWHLIYRQPDDVKIKNTASKIAEGIDTRGDGGYIIVAPSIHPSGGMYRWHKGFSPRDGYDSFPTELIELLVEKEPEPKRELPVINKFPTRALQFGYERVANAGQGTRNDTLNRAAFYLYTLAQRNALNEYEVEEVMQAAALRSGLSQREILSTLHSARKAAMIY